MADRLTWDAVLAFRLRRQHLAERAPAGSLLDVVAAIGGLHAQVASSAELTAWARLEDLARDDVARALWDERTLVKTWAMRGTLHVVPSAELGTWVGAQGVLKPRYETASWRKAFGMSSEEAVAVLDAIRAALDGEPLTRDELAMTVGEALGDPRLGEAVGGSWGVMPKLAAFRGDVCFAPSRGRHVRFTRPDRWLGATFSVAAPQPATVEVVRRYLAAYGPASREAFARWFGTRSAAQAGRLIAELGGAVCEVDVDGEQAWMLAEDVAVASAAEPEGVVRLLPAFDQYVVAAPREGTPVLDAARRALVYRSQGWLSPVLCVDGRVEGVWRHEAKSGRVTVDVEPFGALAKPVRAGVESEAERLAAFLGATLELRIA